MIYHVAGNEDQPVSRFQIPLVPGLTSTIHVAQGTEMFPIIKLDKSMTPTHVFVAMTRSRRSSICLIEPSDKFDFSVFGKGTPLNPKNELLLARLRGDEDFEEHEWPSLPSAYYGSDHGRFLKGDGGAVPAAILESTLDY